METIFPDLWVNKKKIQGSKEGLPGQKQRDEGSEKPGLEGRNKVESMTTVGATKKGSKEQDAW